MGNFIIPGIMSQSYHEKFTYQATKVMKNGKVVRLTGRFVLISPISLE